MFHATVQQIGGVEVAADVTRIAVKLRYQRLALTQSLFKLLDGEALGRPVAYGAQMLGRDLAVVDRYLCSVIDNVEAHSAEVLEIWLRVRRQADLLHVGPQAYGLDDRAQVGAVVCRGFLAVVDEARASRRQIAEFGQICVRGVEARRFEASGHMHVEIVVDIPYDRADYDHLHYQPHVGAPLVECLS